MRIVLVLFFAAAFISCKSDKKDKANDSYTTPSSEKENNISSEVAESINRGSKIYNNFCASCHLASGEGIPSTFPPLNKSNWLTEKRQASIHAIKFGLQGPIEVNGKEYDNLMLDLGLEDQEIADVMNYILNAWNNNISKPVSVEEVEAVEK